MALPSKIKFIAAPAILALAVALFLIKSGPQDIVVVKPQRGPAVQAVYATGTVEASVMLPVAPRNAARLMELHADEGQQVKKNQILAQLEDEDLQKSLDEAQASENLALKEYERRAALVEKGFVSGEAVDQALANWKTAQARTAQVKANLDYMKLLAPEDGTVIRRDGEVGQLIAAHQPVFWLTCCAAYRVSAEVDEEDIPLVRPGQDVLIRADAFPDRTFTGTVDSITPKGDPVARSYRVRITLEPGTPLMIGMTAETNIIIRKTDDALLIPASAIRNGIIYGVKDNKINATSVSLGAQTAQSVEILSGLSDNGAELIVLDASQNLEDGQKINPHLKKWKLH